MTTPLIETGRPIPQGLAEQSAGSLTPKTVVVLWGGDGESNDTLRASLQVLRATGVPLSFKDHDLSRERRMKIGMSVVDDAAADVNAHGYSMKARIEKIPKTSSVNRVLRHKTNADVIERTAFPLPGTSAVDAGGRPLQDQITVVRLAYSERESHREFTEDGDEIAVETRKMSRLRASKVAERAFRVAESQGGIVLGGPDLANDGYDDYDAMFRQELLWAESRHPGVRREEMSAEEVVYYMGEPHGAPVTLPALERDGGFFSFDLAQRLRISPATVPSTTLTLDGEFNHTTVMTDVLEDVTARNDGPLSPVGIILAGGKLLGFMPEEQAQKASTAIQVSVIEILEEGTRTQDLGGNATTKEFARAVAERVQDYMKPTR